MTTTGFSSSGVFKGALIGGAVASVLNTALFFVGRAAGAAYLAMQPGASEAMPIPVVMPTVSTMIASVAAAAILLGLLRVAPARGWTIFLTVSAVVFVAYGAMPVVMLGGDTVAIVCLELMHVVAAIGIVGGIARFGRAG